MGLALEMKMFCGWKWVISTSHVLQIVTNTIFENGGINIQKGILQVLWNILSIS